MTDNLCNLPAHVAEPSACWGTQKVQGLWQASLVQFIDIDSFSSKRFLDFFEQMKRKRKDRINVTIRLLFQASQFFLFLLVQPSPIKVLVDQLQPPLVLRLEL